MTLCTGQRLFWLKLFRKRNVTTPWPDRLLQEETCSHRP